MAANIDPIYPLTPRISWTPIFTAANTAKDGTGTVQTVITAGTNGTKLDQIHIRPTGTNVATVLRFFVNNGATNATATNNTLIHEVTVPASTLSEVAALADTDATIASNAGEITLPIPYLPAGYKLNVTIGTAVAAGLQVTAIGGDY